ncbi:unnamed protein product [Rhizopus microsporus]
MNHEQVWQELCIHAFDNQTEANDFVLFVEGCKTATDNGYVWTTQRPNYQQLLCNIGCSNDTQHSFTLPSETFARLAQIKREARTEWHRRRQEELKTHLKKTLVEIHPLSDLTQTQQLTLIKDGLRGFLKYQLAHKDRLAEWSLSEYVLTQNSEEATEAYVRLLKGILCMQLVYQDEVETNESIAIDIEHQETLLWRMNPDLSNSAIRDILHSLPSSSVDNTSYRLSDIPRQQKEQSVLDWIIQWLTHCLSFLPQIKT